MYSKILVPVDGSDSANAGLREIVKIAGAQPREVLLIHVVEIAHWREQFSEGTIGSIIIESIRNTGRKILEDAQAALARHGVAATQALAESHHQRASEVIVDHAHQWQADLIVMGTHGRHGMRRFVLGSDAAEVVRTSRAPVLLVRDDSSRGEP